LGCRECGGQGTTSKHLLPSRQRRTGPRHGRPRCVPNMGSETGGIR